MPFAEGTTVPVDRSRAEIERLLEKHGAKERGVMLGERVATVFFRAHNRNVLFRLPMPDDKWRRTTPKGTPRYTSENERAQERRRRWRALGLVIKAKLESVASGIEMFEDAFLAQIVVPGGAPGETVADRIREQIARAYEGGAPELRLLPPAPSEE
jgi:hypothetical protein